MFGAAGDQIAATFGGGMRAGLRVVSAFVRLFLLKFLLKRRRAAAQQQGAGARQYRRQHPSHHGVILVIFRTAANAIGAELRFPGLMPSLQITFHGATAC
jgi:hypothetical protein